MAIFSILKSRFKLMSYHPKQKSPDPYFKPIEGLDIERKVRSSSNMYIHWVMYNYGCSYLVDHPRTTSHS